MIYHLYSANKTDEKDETDEQLVKRNPLLYNWKHLVLSQIVQIWLYTIHNSQFHRLLFSLRIFLQFSGGEYNLTQSCTVRRL